MARREGVRLLAGQEDGRTYRLLSEAEWEYAARAGTATAFSTGRTMTTDQANFDGNSTYGGSVKGVYRLKTIEVGSLNKPNAFGLHDMHGNVLGVGGGLLPGQLQRRTDRRLCQIKRELRFPRSPRRLLEQRSLEAPLRPAATSSYPPTVAATSVSASPERSIEVSWRALNWNSSPSHHTTSQDRIALFGCGGLRILRELFRSHRGQNVRAHRARTPQPKRALKRCIWPRRAFYEPSGAWLS